jgi:glycerol dehydrogenase-like iron-containing ADH family enzyme
LQVGLGTIVSCALYERILDIHKPVLHELPQNIDTSYWRNETLIRSVEEQYTLKKDAIKTATQKIAQPETFEQLKNKLQPVVKSPLYIKDLLNRAGAPDSIKNLNIPRKRIKEVFLHMHEIRKRFSVIDLAWLTGILPAAVDEIIDTYL